MYVLNFWHTVTDYGEWKKIFDTDPLGRQASGVRRVTIERPVEIQTAPQEYLPVCNVPYLEDAGGDGPVLVFPLQFLS